MDKIPVGATIARAYGFVFGRFFSLVGIVWLSWAVLAAASLLLRSQSADLSMAMATRDFSAIGSALVVLIPFYIAGTILVLIQYMGITEQALGLRRGSPYFYFKLGQPLWLLALSFLLLVFIFIALLVAVSFAGGLLTPTLIAAGGRVAGALAAVLLFLALFCGVLYIALRLGFLIPPVVVAENRMGLARAWELGKGNFWRIFIIVLVVLLPILVLTGILIFGVLAQGLPPSPGPNPDPAQLAQYRAAVSAAQAAMAARMASYWYITYPIYLIITVVFYGLSAAAQAFAYRALVPEDIAETFS